jgi:hypothetical protein
MVDSSERIAKFSKVYGQRVLDTQGTSITRQSMPTLEEMDDMLEQIAKIHMSLQHLRDIVSGYHIASVSKAAQDSLLRY